jgi:hypothetical protein
LVVCSTWFTNINDSTCHSLTLSTAPLSLNAHQRRLTAFSASATVLIIKHTAAAIKGKVILSVLHPIAIIVLSEAVCIVYRTHLLIIKLRWLITALKQGKDDDAD